MNSRAWSPVLPSSAILKDGLISLILVAGFLAVAPSGFAASPSNASLSGTYVFHFSTVREVNWYATKSCHYTNITYTYSGGGQSANTEIVKGEATFDGKGHVSIDYTDIHHFDSAASNATVSITCPASPGDPVNTNNGHMVLDPPAAGTLTGSYVVESDGSATISLADGYGSLDLNLTAFDSAGLSTTFLIINPDSAENYGSGIGVHK